MPIHLDVEIFHRIGENFDLLLQEQSKVTEESEVIKTPPLGAMDICTKVYNLSISCQDILLGVIRTRTLGTMNACTTFHGSASNSCWDISMWIKVVAQVTDQLTSFESRC